MNFTDLLSPEAIELRTYMSKLSNDLFCAGWVSDLEYHLWEAIQSEHGPRGESGKVRLKQEEIATLRRLSSICNGWIVCLESTNPVHYHFIPLDCWALHYGNRDAYPLPIAALAGADVQPTMFVGILDSSEFHPNIKKSILLFDKVIVASVPEISQFAISHEEEGDYVSYGVPTSLGFHEYEPEEFPWMADQEYITGYTVSLHDTIGSENETRIFKRFVHAQTTQSRLLTKRIAAMQLLRLHGLSAFPIHGTPGDIYTDLAGKTGHVLKVVLHNLPVPDEDSSWEDVRNFKSDKANIGRFLELKRYISELARTDSDIREIANKIEYLLNTYEKAYKIHKIKCERTDLEVVFTTVPDIVGKFVKCEFGDAVRSILSIGSVNVGLLEAEMGLPGREVAYLHHAQTRFGKG